MRPVCDAARPTVQQGAGDWSAKTAIHSTWGGDLFVILHSGEADGKVNLTFVENPLMRWLWLGGCLAALGRHWGCCRRNGT